MSIGIEEKDETKENEIVNIVQAQNTRKNYFHHLLIKLQRKL